MSQRGVRWLNGREFLLAGRADSLPRAVDQRQALLKEWTLVRIIKRRDWDYMLYVHAKREQPADTFQGSYLILVRAEDRKNLRGGGRGKQPGQWYLPLDGGPWTDYDAAETFARNEVGVPWIIVKVVSTEGHRG